MPIFLGKGQSLITFYLERYPIGIMNSQKKTREEAIHLCIHDILIYDEFTVAISPVGALRIIGG